MEVAPLRIVVVGDGAVGKTSLIASAALYTDSHMPQSSTAQRPCLAEPIRTMAHTLTVPVPGQPQPCRLTLMDTAVDEDEARTALYARAQLCLVLYSIVAPHSYQNVHSKHTKHLRSVLDRSCSQWLPELRRCAPDLPVILVATKCDLRDNAGALERLSARGSTVVSQREGKEMQKEIGAARFLECAHNDEQSVLNLVAEMAQLSVPGATSKKPTNCQCDIV